MIGKAVFKKPKSGHSISLKISPKLPSHLTSSQISLNVSHSPPWSGHVLPPCSFSVKSTHPFLCLSPFLSHFCSIALSTVYLPSWVLCFIYCLPFYAVNHCCAPSPMCSPVLLPPPLPHLYLLDHTPHWITCNQTSILGFVLWENSGWQRPLHSPKNRNVVGGWLISHVTVRNIALTYDALEWRAMGVKHCVLGWLW